MSKITQKISNFPTPPNSSTDSPPEFNAKADAFVNHQSGVYISEVNSWASQANTLRDEVNDAKTYIDNTIATLPIGTVNDTIISKTTVWSSQKVSDELRNTKPVNNMTIGNINNPLLDLPLNNSLDMKQGVGQAIFTRATTATYINRYGVLNTASVDEPRFEKDGLLIEGTSTNIITNSNDLSSGSIVRSTVSASESPDGGNDGILVTMTENNSAYIAYANTTVDSGINTISVFAKAGSNRYISLRTTGYDNNVTKVFVLDDTTEFGKEKLDNGWYRIQVSFETTTNLTGIVLVYSQSSADLGAGVVGGDVHVYGLQVEHLDSASSYIPTQSSQVTRAAESLQFQYKDNANAYNGHSSVAVDVKLKKCGNTQVMFNSNSKFTMYVSAAGSVFALNGSDGYAYAPNFYTLPMEQTHRIVSTFDGSTISLYGNGVQIATNAATYSTIAAYINIYIGYGAGSSYPMYGHIKNFRIWDRALTEEEARLA